MTKPRATLDFGGMSFEKPKPDASLIEQKPTVEKSESRRSRDTRPKKVNPETGKGRGAAIASQRAAIENGFVPRAGEVVDGRTLRSKGVRVQLNMKVPPEFRDKYQIAAADKGMTNGEYLEWLFLNQPS